MAEKVKPDIFGGFQALSESLTGGITLPKDTDVKEIDDLEEILEEEEETEELDKGEKDDKRKKTTKEKPEEDTPGEEDQEAEGETGQEDKETGEVDGSELSEFEPDITKFFQDKLGEELGWEFDENEKFESVKDLVDYMRGAVEEASKPTFANEEI